MSHPFSTIFCAHCGTEHQIPVYCGDRFCEICGRPRLAKIKERLRQILALPDRAPKGHRLKHIVLTLRNQPKALDMSKDLIKYFKALRNTRLWQNKISGGAYFLEITGVPGDWHAHLHIICDGTYFPHKQLSTIWERISKSKIVWVNEINARAAISYLASYVTKKPIDEVIKADLNEALKAFRMFQTFGKWHALKINKVRYTFPCPKCGKKDWVHESVINRCRGR